MDEFISWLSSHGIAIDPNVPSTHSCTTVLTAAEMAAYDAEWEDRAAAAISTFNSEDESDAEAAEVACYQDIYNALDAKCNP